MAISTDISEEEIQLLNSNTTVEDCVDHKGRPSNRLNSGRWRSAFLIIGVEVAERFAFFGITLNLITYLTGPLGLSTATGAASLNVWYGTASLLPLLGAFVADSYIGRYRTIIIASVIYILGLGLLTLSAVLPSLYSCHTQNASNAKESCSSRLQIILFYFSLYLVAVAQGGHKPCIQAFGADQFDSRDPEEMKAKSSFFNWWYFTIVAINTVTISILNYIQDNLGWGLGFGIPCIVMILALIIFLLGTTIYRFSRKGYDKSLSVKIGLAFRKAFRNRRISTSKVSAGEEAEERMQDYQQFKFLDKTSLASRGLEDDVRITNEVEEGKGILGLLPLWATCLVFAIVYAQAFTLFTEQGVTMDRSIGPNFKVPAASMLAFTSLSTVILIPIYDRVLVPSARAITGKPSGITMLQRIGTGLVFSLLSVVIAAVVEMKRLETARKYGLVDMPDAVVPMSIWWLIPQYLLFGIAEVFAYVGLQEFFYDQVPSGLRSTGLALYLSIFGVGSFLSSFLIYAIEKATGGEGRDSWFSDNLNRAHLDYFYWLLAALSTVTFIAFLYYARFYNYNCKNAL
ncbi:Protein NRT1/PTR FAMILY 5.10 [Forsythia ovata]|uniref:Protein NRT1/PTR FAMILY 5.10 n=1 Tax=Forsythia ovata TaxID=205694 RepID=A0ABD1VNP4_9LAMI